MKGQVLVDTGPLVALLDRRDAHHQWARTQFSLIRPPLLTCESVLSEACFLLKDIPQGSHTILELLAGRVVMLAFSLAEELQPVARLMTRYAKVPMSLADACLVRMAEQYSSHFVLTLDRDFTVYRKHGRQVIPTIRPPD